VALRTQQILAHETGVAQVIDPLGGSYYIEALTDQLEREAEALFAEINSIGGVVRGIESGWFQRQIAQSAAAFQRQVELGEKVIVGVNEFLSDDDHPVEILRSPMTPRKSSAAGWPASGRSGTTPWWSAVSTPSGRRPSPIRT